MFSILLEDFLSQLIFLYFQHLAGSVLTFLCSIIKPILSLIFSSMVSRTVNSRRKASAAPTSNYFENRDAGKSFLVSKIVYPSSGTGMNLDLASSCLCIPKVCLLGLEDR